MSWNEFIFYWRKDYFFGFIPREASNFSVIMRGDSKIYYSTYIKVSNASDYKADHSKVHCCLKLFLIFTTCPQIITESKLQIYNDSSNQIFKKQGPLVHIIKRHIRSTCSKWILAIEELKAFYTNMGHKSMSKLGYSQSARLG